MEQKLKIYFNVVQINTEYWLEVSIFFVRHKKDLKIMKSKIPSVVHGV